MMPRRNIFILFVTGILLASCQKRDCDSFDIVGVWRLDQETYSDGYVNTNTLNRYKIFYKDNTFICLRIFLNEHDKTFIPYASGKYSLNGTSYLENGKNNSFSVENDSTIHFVWGDAYETYVADRTLRKSMLKEIKRETEKRERDNDGFIENTNEYSFTLEEISKRSKRKNTAIISLLLLTVCTAGSSIVNRRRRNVMESRLREIESEMRHMDEENRHVRAAGETRYLDSDFYMKLCQMIDADEPLKGTDWNDLESQVESLSPGFSSRLNSLYRLSLLEYRVCLLLKAHLSPAQISVLICKSQSAVSSIRSRLYQKVFGKKGGAKDWDEFIGSL